ncbi:hypothetical protein D910_12160 [Dendroctonus ponderosae]|uniref:Reverse transcriptase domain-containing protein n=1 Tax=Dendroctonus ponderosae TaxID=77166 RepID=U4UP57_DENPD|nr:hypothetical protein D910_12160 [Dendroctonus ponderosae]
MVTTKLKTLTERARRICEPDELEGELKHLERAFGWNGCSKKDFNRTIRPKTVKIARRQQRRMMSIRVGLASRTYMESRTGSARYWRNTKQKGFVAEPGCFTNIHILNELLRHSKAFKGLVLTQVDISKAFDTIPHCAIAPALTCKGLPAHMVSKITKAYKYVATIIQSKATVDSSLQRCVKHGDPLSPTNFNLMKASTYASLRDRHSVGGRQCPHREKSVEDFGRILTHPGLTLDSSEGITALAADGYLYYLGIRSDPGQVLIGNAPEPACWSPLSESV